MSQKIYVPCNDSKQEIGVFNHLKVLYIPSGVTVEVSFNHTPRPEEIYPLTDTVADLDSNGYFVDAKRCFLHITGIDVEDIQLIASNVTPEDGYVKVDQQATVGLELTTKKAIEDSIFAPSANAEQVDILAGGNHVMAKGVLKAIRYHSTDEVGVELDSNGIKYPMFEDIMYLNNIDTDVTFYNDTAATITLTIWKMS